MLHSTNVNQLLTSTLVYAIQIIPLLRKTIYAASRQSRWCETFSDTLAHIEVQYSL